MATVSPNTLRTTPIALVDGETLVVGTGGVVATPITSVTGAAGGSNELLILGSLFADNGNAINLDQGYLLELVVGTEGGVFSTGSTAAVLRGGSQVVVANHGVITATNGSALQAQGTVADSNATIDVTNTGTLSARHVSLIASSGTQDTFVVNSGTISSTGGYAVLLSATTGKISLVNSGYLLSAEGRGVSFGGSATINNTGVIQSQSISILGFGSLQLKNDGTIQSNSDTAVSASGGGSLANSGQITGNVTFNGITTITNSGEIIGVVNMTAGGTLSNTGDVRGSVAASGVSDTVRNFGLIEGDLFLGGGDDIVRNAGFAGGNVFLSDGNDIYRGFGGQVVESVDGGTGADTLNGGTFDDTFSGGDDADILRGRGGDDSLHGGAGKDKLVGGAGEDFFVFSAITDSAKGRNADVITDFRRGVDDIDLSEFSTTLTFIGTAGFSDQAGEVRIRSVAGATMVQIDEDGNGTADMEIRVLGVTTLSGSDFIL